MISRVTSLKTIYSRRCVHNVAAKGFHEDNVQLYDSARPEYPATTIRYIDSIIADANKRNNRSSSNIVELGSGTGKFTKSFLRNTNLSGSSLNTYVATDPSLPFLKKLESNLTGGNFHSWDLSAKPGAGSNIPSLSASVSAVLAAQCFHWMSDDHTLAEISRVCQPDSPFIMIWNYYDCNVDWLRRLEYDIVDPIYAAQEKKDGSKTPRYATQDWQNAFKTELAKQKFHLPVKFFKDSQTVVSSEAALIEKVLSTSVVNVLPDDEKDNVRKEISTLLRTHPDTRHANSYNVVYEITVAHVTTK